MQKSSQDSAETWLSAAEFGRSLRGFGVNLLVIDVLASVRFAEAVLLADCVYQSVDFACMRRGDVVWQYHADHCYDSHALYGFVRGSDGEPLRGRGAGIELRFYDIDPDLAVERARGGGYIILADAIDRPHGLREAFILDDDGYCWVVSLPSQA